MSPGQSLRAAVEAERPLQVPGVVNAYSAMLAQRAGFRALYLSGGALAATLGLPDLGITTLNDVCEDVRPHHGPRAATAPRGRRHRLGRSVLHRPRHPRPRQGRRGWPGHLEDQVQAKRCGHRRGKELVACDEMCDRLRAAADGRASSRDDQFVLMARTDAFANEGLDAAVERAARYVEAGADMIFAEALATLDDYRAFTSRVSVPVLANITEFGKTPLFTVDELREVGVRLALYPLSAYRAMNAAAVQVFSELRKEGTQKGVVGLRCRRAPNFTMCSATTRGRTSSTRCLRRGKAAVIERCGRMDRWRGRMDSRVASHGTARHKRHSPATEQTRAIAICRPRSGHP